MSLSKIYWLQRQSLKPSSLLISLQTYSSSHVPSKKANCSLENLNVQFPASVLSSSKRPTAYAFSKRLYIVVSILKVNDVVSTSNDKPFSFAVFFLVAISFLISDIKIL